MEKLSLIAQPRTLKGRATEALREQSQIPAVLYGSGREAQMVSVDRVSFIKAFRLAGFSGLVELTIGTEVVPVLIQDFQQHPISDFVTHVDFRAVDMMKEVEATVQLRFVGESMAVKALGGTLVESMDELQVTALPSALVSHLDVDISALATLDDMIHVRDLALPEGMKVDEDVLDEVVATVSGPRSEAELDALNEEVVEDVASVASAKPEKEESEDADKAE